MKIVAYRVPYVDAPFQYWVGEVSWRRTDQNGVEWVRLCKKTYWKSGEVTEQCCVLPARWLEENATPITVSEQEGVDDDSNN